MVLPEPVLSADDVNVIEEKLRNPSSLISNTWIKDTTKLTVLRVMASCLARLDCDSVFNTDITYALAQKSVCFLHLYSLEVEEVLKKFQVPFKVITMPPFLSRESRF